MKKLPTTLLTLLIAGAATAVIAKPIDRIMARMDSNEDGFVSIDEFGPRRLGMIDRIDEDGDGAVTLDEINQHIADRQEEMAERHAAMQSRMQEFFAKADADGDGSVTKDEAKNAAFDRIDENNDGQLTEEELRNAKPEHDGRKHRRRHGGGPGGS
ncbi:MAG: EF-hand domain-containing protein [Gammaproteobacteria bacterium]|jgi:Ca2+-binding EF-hand superfamily protein|nr:EF-hand domain-containing protein [Gammaproteobacteria bacterium]MBT4492345.1 EF-hand domain-containing protein [Gammaproteobacteria bacterium]MBT7371982.1 EF-hand domain-containing protein [Gammaproteobacteria bacterium]